VLFYAIAALFSWGLLRAQTPDSSFNPNINFTVHSLAVQADGKILTGGDFVRVGGVERRFIARFNADGTLDSSFNPNANGIVTTIAVQGDGKILIGGGFTAVGGVTRGNLARLNPDGTVDSSFNQNSSPWVQSLALQSDGKILIGGSFTTVGGVARNNVARLNADGTLDSSFNPNASHDVNCLEVQADGKILMGGFFTSVGGIARNYIARLNADGTLDSSFNPNASYQVFSLAVQADSKILIGGQFTTVGGVTRSRIARLNADGTLDSTFNPNVNGGFSPNVRSLAVQADGKILMAGYFTAVGTITRNNLARLNADGTLDSSFNPNPNGSLITIAVQENGKILIGGSFTAVGGVSRNHIALITNNISATSSLTVTGTSQINWTRGGSGPELEQVTFERWNGSAWISLGSATRVSGGWRRTGLSLSTSGWIRARGRSSAGTGIIGQTLAYGSPTAPDITVAMEGVGTLVYGSAAIDFGTLLWPSTPTKTITLTNSGNASLTGLSLALSGADPGDFTTSALAATALAPGESISFTVTFSMQAMGVLRGSLLSITSNDPDETPFTVALGGKCIQTEPSFNPNANDWVSALAVQADGKILMGGYFRAVGGVARSGIARLNTNGTLDSSFDPGAGGDVSSLAVQADGKILLGGNFSYVGPMVRNCIARLNADGTVDSSFNPNSNSDVVALAVQADGKILIGGSFTTVGGVVRNCIARLNVDGTLDSSFNPNVNSWISSLAVQADGKILIGGQFTAVGGVTRNYIARLNANGTLDSSFNPNAGYHINSLVVQANGKILIGGNFTTVGGVARGYFARLNSDGTVDSAFHPKVSSIVYDIAVQADGKILLGGSFTTIGEVTRNRIARLHSDGMLDMYFNPNMNVDRYSYAYALAVQADGKVLIGGVFGSLGGVARNHIALVTNDIPSTSTLSLTDTTQIDWKRGGSVPEIEQVIFEEWTGSAWVSLGNATRVPEGWSKTGLSLSASGQIRARGRTSNSKCSGFIEQTVRYGSQANPVEAWRQQFFGTTLDAGSAADLADPDGDGLPNLMERAFNLSPTQCGVPILVPGSGTSGLPAISSVGDGASRRLKLDYVRLKASAGHALYYTPQFSSDLISGWQNFTGNEAVQSIDADWERVTVEEAAGGHQKRFGRVRLETSP
jgi:uncharacterized delta-60 repeat protein